MKEYSRKGAETRRNELFAVSDYRERVSE